LKLVTQLHNFNISYYRRENEPPIPRGHWFWGNGEDFAKNAVSFLHKSQKKLGDIFTIRLFNQHMTVIMDPHSYESFVKVEKIKILVNIHWFESWIINIALSENCIKQ
jgi:hypothetical protein